MNWLTANRNPAWFKPLKLGDNQLEFKDFYGGTVITKAIANQLLDDYYEEREWQKNNGIPSQEKLKELGLAKYI